MEINGTNGAARVIGKPGKGPSHPRIGVPELAGVCTYAEAARPGLGVEENVARLKRFNWIECRLTDLMLTQVTATPEWEVKDALCHHAWLDAEHAKWLQERVAELRHPPHNFHTPPDPQLEAWLQEALRSSGTVELLVALYRVIKPELLAEYRRHLEQANPLVDQPTRRILRFIIQEEEDMLRWGEAALAALVGEPEREAATAWEAHLRAYLEAAPAAGSEVEAPAAVPAPRAVAPLEPDWFPRRDARFQSYNYHFPPHWIYAQPDRPADERMLALVCKRLLEMDVPEMMASIIWKARQAALAAGTPKPWGYTAEMCRQMWDEARHSMMGEAWLVSKGIDFTRVPLNVGFSLGLNRSATPLEAHAALYWIEQGLMPKTTGKAYEWRTAREANDPLATLFMDYDWADEVLHVHIGRRWLVKEVGSREEAERQGSEAFSRVMAIRRQHGLEGAAETEQSEWWPDFCEEVLGYRPEPLAAEVYETADEDAPWLRNG
ncbi:MAG: hypothetical protein K0Q72_2098 [Armatimonadetes bacterium]|jgi:hypothetical protein|nr:hypothetical protein [Armatimonadota bacterium]